MEKSISLFVAVSLAWFGNPIYAFTCTSTGLFPNTDSNDCKTFVSCGYNMQPELHSCPENSFFWPAKNGCFSQYNCADNSIPSNTNPCEGNKYYGVPDPLSSDCSKYIQCGQSYAYNSQGGQSFEYSTAISVQCDSGSAFRPDGGCVSGYKCANYPCTSEGVFPNPNSVDCTTFVECWKHDMWLNSGMVTTLHSNVIQCPINSRFNPHLKKCDSIYVCGQNNPHGGVDPCEGQSSVEDYSVGAIVPNQFDSTQKSYLSCRYKSYDGYSLNNYVYRDGILKQECPDKTLFSPHLRKCYGAHIPNEICSKDPCSSGPGEYVNYPSGGCQTFLKCIDDSTDRKLYEPSYELRYCPPGTLFSPTAGMATGKCVPGYACPNFSPNYCYPAVSTTTSTTPEAAAGA